MSQENVEIVKRSFEAYASGGIDAARVFLHPDVVWNAADEAPSRGPDEVVAYMKRWEGEWEHFGPSRRSSSTPDTACS